METRTDNGIYGEKEFLANYRAKGTNESVKTLFLKMTKQCRCGGDKTEREEKGELGIGLGPRGFGYSRVVSLTTKMKGWAQ